MNLYIRLMDHIGLYTFCKLRITSWNYRYTQVELLYDVTVFYTIANSTPKHSQININIGNVLPCLQIGDSLYSIILVNVNVNWIYNVQLQLSYLSFALSFIRTISIKLLLEAFKFKWQMLDSCRDMQHVQAVIKL